MVIDEISSTLISPTELIFLQFVPCPVCTVYMSSFETYPPGDKFTYLKIKAYWCPTCEGVTENVN